MPSYIPVNTPLLSGNEKKYLADCIDSGWISSEGPYVEKFEKTFAGMIGRSYAVSVSNGTAALQIAVEALEISKGDEVIMPTFTIISCALAIIRSGATPVLVDCDPVTWNMDVSQIEKKITSKTKAIMVVHIYGLPVDMDPVIAIAKKHHLLIIEDAAEAHGLTYKGKSCGSFGDISIFSFYPNKLITTGEGGMILTNDKKIAERCRSYRNLCFQKERRFVHEEMGWNYRMCNLQAAVGLAQCERISMFIRKKLRMGKHYSDLLSDLVTLTLPPNKTEYARNIYWVYGIVMKNNVSFDAFEFMRRLSEKGIGTRPFFWPMNKQPVFLRMGLFKNEVYPIAERIAKRGLYLPSGLAITDLQIEKVASTVKKILS